MKIVLDTNVLISGIFWSGPPGFVDEFSPHFLSPALFALSKINLTLSQITVVSFSFVQNAHNAKAD